MLHHYGLSEDILASTFHRVQDGKEHLQWTLKGIPEIGFYQELHQFLKRWSVTRGKTKQAVGKFYIAIDQNLKNRGTRADNVYRLIERVCQSKQPSTSLMSYGPDQAAADVKVMRTQLKECTKQVEEMTSEYNELKRKFEASRKQLHCAQQALRDVTNEKLKVQKQRDAAKKKAEKFKQLRSEYGLLEEEFMQLQEENLEVSTAIAALETELTSESDNYNTTVSDIADFTFQTKSGRRYSPAIRKLYYGLLSNQIPSSKIVAIIKMIVKCFNPSIDVEKLKLPQRTCADYMRREELKTISNAHKATVLCEHATNKGFSINTDGTTKFQKKIGGVVVNNMVVSVNELPDGTAESAIADVSREFEKLHQTAHALGMPNPNSINWTLLVALTSDSASTKKRINKLIEQCREEDEAKYGPATIETVELVENFCSMHLGINLRKAFISGIDQSDDDLPSRKYHPVDALVHEFCKLFGKYGTPEYGCGVLAFPDFLALKQEDSSLSEEDRTYYQSCSAIKLDRQVGSRYFVSAANAAKIVFLAEAAVCFLKYTGKDVGNKLETDLLMKLLDKNKIAQLRADGLMYFHVYADIVMLSKSVELGKTVLDMNQHYLELKLFLQEVESNPAVVLNKEYQVFSSEGKLYENAKETNHRCHPSSQVVYNRLFASSECDSVILHPLLVSGAAKMKEKLCTYARNQLPGGEYWDPDVSIRKVLMQLKPSNDVCESILGLNDYLTTAIPNLHQMGRSNLIQVKKNQTMKWLDELPCEQQLKVLDLAVKQRENVAMDYKHEEQERSKQRRKKHVAIAHKKGSIETKSSARTR